MTDEAEVATRCAGCGERPLLRNGHIVHMRYCPTLSEAGSVSVPLPTPTPPEDRQALRDRIAEALLAGDVSEMDVPDSEEEFWGLVTDIAVMPVVDELRAEVAKWTADAKQMRAVADEALGELASTREELAEAKRNYDDQMQIRMEVEKVLDVALGTEEDDGAGMGLVGDVALLADRLKSASEELEDVRATLAHHAFTAPDASFADMFASLGARLADRTAQPGTVAVPKIVLPGECQHATHSVEACPIAAVSPAVPEDPATPKQRGHLVSYQVENHWQGNCLGCKWTAIGGFELDVKVMYDAHDCDDFPTSPSLPEEEDQ
jgi:hypothetical protein